MLCWPWKMRDVFGDLFSIYTNETPVLSFKLSGKTITLMTTCGGPQLQTIHSDNGYEFLSKQMQTCFHDNGIVHQCSCVVTP